MNLLLWILVAIKVGRFTKTAPFLIGENEHLPPCTVHKESKLLWHAGNLASSFEPLSKTLPNAVLLTLCWEKKYKIIKCMQFKQILLISRFFRERSSAVSLVVYYVVSRPYFETPLRFRWIPSLKNWISSLSKFISQVPCSIRLFDYHIGCRNVRYCQQHIPPTH